MANTCKRCGTAYTRIDGIKRLRSDYGYCSISCMEADKAPCPNCGSPITRRPDEKPFEFAKRRFCCQKCAVTYTASAPKSRETRAKMCQAAAQRTPEQIAQRVESRRLHYASEAGKQSLARQVAGYRAWLRDHPDEAAEMRAKIQQSAEANGSFAATSQRMKAFFQSQDGAERRAHYRQLYAGKPRPPRVTVKAQLGIRKFWDSPEGIALREQKSSELTKDFDAAPPGPGWRQQAFRAKKRDGRKCVLCSRRDDARALSVHHIYSRRRYGFVPGVNRNYLWANHLANLITLCRSCHTSIHMGVLAVPESYQERADALWTEFMNSAPTTR